MTMRIITIMMFFVSGVFGATDAFCSTSSNVHFVNPGDFAIGIEPELSLTHGAGIAANLKYIQGLNDLMNVTGILGTGEGQKKFRIGSSMMFDFFPDIEGQPGMGIATQGIYYRLTDTGQFEMTVAPYIHKIFYSGINEVEPYLTLPFGMSFLDGQYKPISNIVLGAMFKSTENLRYSMEFGVAINNTESHISGGIIYFH